MTSINVEKWLTETITVKRATSHTAYGDASFGAAFTAAARIERGSVNVPDAEGRRTSERTTLFTQTELRVQDLVWLPGTNTSDVNDARQVVSVDRRQALDGTITQYVSELG